MKYVVFIGFLLASCIACQTPNAKQISFHSAHNATVQIFSADGGRGSASYIGNGYFLTAWHVIADKDNKMYYSYNGQMYEMELHSHAVQMDLALLKAKPANGLTSLNISKTGPKLGDKCYSIGFQFGFPELHMLTDGIISQLYYDMDSRNDVFIYSAPINSGSSGGCVLNENLEIIGVNQFIISNTGDWCGISASTSYENLIDFLTISNIKL